MTVSLAPIINDQQENSNGAPLSGGTIEVYLAGSSTPKTTYSDKAGLIANTWPIVLNTLGVNNQGAVWITNGFLYKFIIKDTNGVVQRTIDNVSGINDYSFLSSEDDQWKFYSGTPTYISGTSFSLSGDRRAIFQVYRRVKTINSAGTIYSTILSSTYNGTTTVVTLKNDSGALDSGISSVYYGIISVLDTSLYKEAGLVQYTQGATYNISTVGYALNDLYNKYNTLSGQISDLYLQIAKCIKSIRIILFTASGTYTPSATMVYCDVQIVGAGSSSTFVQIEGGAYHGIDGSSAGYCRNTYSASSIGVGVSFSIGSSGPFGGATTFLSMNASNVSSGGYINVNSGEISYSPLLKYGQPGRGINAPVNNPGTAGAILITEYLS